MEVRNRYTVVNVKVLEDRGIDLLDGRFFPGDTTLTKAEQISPEIPIDSE